MHGLYALLRMRDGLQTHPYGDAILLVNEDCYVACEISVVFVGSGL